MRISVNRESEIPSRDRPRRSKPAPSAGALAAIATLALVLTGTEARAVPSFARQMNLPCTSCHTAFPQLTPFGRLFKLSGYTLSSHDTSWPPLAVMIQGGPGFTHTGKGQAASDLPARFDGNDNVSLNQISLFYAGRMLGPYASDVAGERVAGVLDSVGVFAQGTWDGVGNAWAWDNMELRAARSATLAGASAVLGGYVNNNPTLQDPWNTTPAWGFPFSGSGLAPAPAAAPLLAGGLSQQVLGFGGYGMLEHSLYVEAGAYTTLSADAQRALGVDPTDETQIDGLAPYWRVAVERTSGPHVVELGTFGLRAATFPGRDASAGHDHITDVGLDLQYQWLTGPHDVTVLASSIYELQDLSASRALGLAENSSNDLRSTTLTASYLFDGTYGIDAQYFVTSGDRDDLLYGGRRGRPNSDGWVFQLDYLPINKAGGPDFWPRSNVKLSLQYTLYQHFDGAGKNFDGAGRDAADNDTLYVEAWTAF